MLLGARQFFERRGAPTPPLPYDAEVEWLQGTYGGYIDTGIKSTRSISADVSFSILNPVQSERGGIGIMLYGLGTSWDFQSYAVYFQNTASQPDIGKVSAHGNYIQLYAPNGNHDYRLVATADGTATVKMSLYVDGQLAVTDKKVGISKVNGSMNFTLLWNRNLRDGDDSWIKTRISSAKLIENGVALFNAIPVRVGSVGYMYDRVSGQLFRNAGTGAFQIGPDKTAWTNPYVTDGLVAMWDGEWNAGGGVHDPNATTWKELVSGTDCAIVGNLSTDYSWSGKSLVRNTEGRGYFLYDATARLQDSFRNATFTVEATTSQPVNNANWQAQIINICQTSQVGSYSQGMISRWRRENNGTMGSLSGATYLSGAGLTLTTTEALATFACTYNAGQYVSYLDGEQKSTGSATPDSTIDGVWVRLGSSGYGFRGHYHSVRLYSRALTADEIAANYAIDKARFNLP